MLLQVYKGYVDDPRNTDNAWMETVAVNFHDDTGEVFSEFKLQVSNLFRLFSCEVSRSVSVDIHIWLYIVCKENVFLIALKNCDKILFLCLFFFSVHRQEMMRLQYAGRESAVTFRSLQVTCPF